MTISGVYPILSHGSQMVCLSTDGVPHSRYRSLRRELLTTYPQAVGGQELCYLRKCCAALCASHSPPPPAAPRVCLRLWCKPKSTMQVFTDGLEVMSNMGAVVNSLFSRVQKNLVQTI